MSLTEDIMEAYEELCEHISHFPMNCCKHAATAMYVKGYDIIQGFVRLDDKYNPGESRRVLHYWNYDRSTSTYFDLTAGQFSSGGKPLLDIMTWKENEANPMYELKRKNVKPREVL
jgi:hypothetical protein